MKLLLNRYHPIVDDLALSFSKIDDLDVTVCIDTSIVDHYGSHLKILKSNKKKYSQFKTISLKEAIIHLKNDRFDIVGVDGVFEGDKFLLEISNDKNIANFCISGYPYLSDEPSKNILSFSFFLPQMQYIKNNPSENHVKSRDWKNIYEDGKSSGKNILVFYPEFNLVKEFAKNNKIYFSNELISLIHRFEECNHWNYKVFDRLKREVEPLGFAVNNYSNLSQMEVYKKISESAALLHMKSFDCPGISLLECLILSKPVIVMDSFVRGSFDQEILIDNFNAIICSSYEELKERVLNEDFKNFLNPIAKDYIWSLTSFDRQKYKFEKFIERCF